MNKINIQSKSTLRQHSHAKIIYIIPPHKINDISRTGKSNERKNIAYFLCSLLTVEPFSFSVKLNTKTWNMNDFEKWKSIVSFLSVFPLLLN